MNWKRGELVGVGGGSSTRRRKSCSASNAHRTVRGAVVVVGGWQ